MSGWNPFLGRQTAQTYARARPDYHPSAIAALVGLLDLAVPVRVAVDVGCGTGMSTRATRTIADRVLGVDVSRPMLTEAEPLPGVLYVQAEAERLPVRDESADLIVAAAAFHWFEQATMLAEVVRVLAPGAAFVTYTDFFSGQLSPGRAGADWLASTYRPSFPAPPRRSHFEQQAAEEAGLRFVGQGPLAHEVPMTAADLTEYLLSQSNATHAVEEGRITMAELRRWLITEIGSRLPSESAVMAQFTGKVWCCRK